MARSPAGRFRSTARPLGGMFGEAEIGEETRLWRGKSLALVVWPGKHPSGKLIVNETYLPETVDSVDGLKERAALYGCRHELDAGLNWLRTCLSGWPPSGSYAMAVILLARRPFAVIGSESPIELCPYVVEVGPPRLFADNGATVVSSGRPPTTRFPGSSSLEWQALRLRQKDRRGRLSGRERTQRCRG